MKRVKYFFRQPYVVIANFLCVPFGTMISIFTLNIFKKLGQKPFYIPPANTK
jgi:hypothetical protein